MIINRQSLLLDAPIKDMIPTKVKSEHGVSHGLSEAGYDIRLAQEIWFTPGGMYSPQSVIVDGVRAPGSFTIASAMEEFQMPPHLAGIVHDKSTHIRRGLCVFNTVIEPGWKGFLTLELNYFGNERLHLPAGIGIAQVIFHQVSDPTTYSGKYQGQENRPVDAILERS